MNAHLNTVYLDSNIFIFACSSDETVGVQCARILDSVVKGKISAVTTLLTFDELFYTLYKDKGFEAAVLFSENFLAMPNLSLADVDSEIIHNSLQLIKQYRLAPRDGIHAATAQRYKVDVFVSDDGDFSKVKELEWLDIANFIARLEQV
ncbi:type II toxin-antitoxin system VapC family toxin [Candidatus Woesearchaeota archaeon]|nr:type II toxin-antitoxin system VapC family toxin [Candidatus Woesearchaeota archaeon]